MSRKLKVIVSSLAVAVIIALVSTFYPASSSFAYSDGLLHEKDMMYHPYTGITGGTPIQYLTDNDETTSKIWNTNQSAYYTFEEAANLTGFKLKANNSYLSVSFYDINKKVLGIYRYNNPLKIDGTTMNISEMSNVKTVQISNDSNYPVTILEFDVFGVLTSVPTPTPTVTPIPTVTPEPTPTVTPEPTPDIPFGDRAILTIELTTGADEEFDLPMSEVNAFLTWYDSAAGSARYGIDKHDNNKGPFSKRTEYVIHDKILTFEVSEYTAQ